MRKLASRRGTPQQSIKERKGCRHMNKPGRRRKKELRNGRRMQERRDRCRLPQCLALLCPHIGVHVPAALLRCLAPECTVEKYPENDLIAASLAGSPDALSPGDMPPKDLMYWDQEPQKERVLWHCKIKSSHLFVTRFPSWSWSILRLLP